MRRYSSALILKTCMDNVFSAAIAVSIIAVTHGCQPVPTNASFPERLDAALAEIEAQNLNVIVAVAHGDGPHSTVSLGLRQSIQSPRSRRRWILIRIQKR